MSEISNQEKDLKQLTLEELKQRIPAKDLPKVEKEALEKWKNALLSNNDVFINFCNNKKICKALVHVLLKSFDVKLFNPNIVYEKSANISFDSKEVKFDMYVEDDYIIIDMEMQVVIRLMPPERIRTYQAAIDIEQIKKSGNYDELKDTFIIIICLNDPFGYELPAYRIQKTPVGIDLDEFNEGEFDFSQYVDNNFDKSLIKNIEDFDLNKFDDYLKKMKRKHKKTLCEEYKDGANIVFFNASAFYKVKNKELRTFLAFIMGFHINDCGFYHIINERYKNTKITEEVELSYMTSYFREYDIRTLIIEELTESITEELTESITEELTESITEELTESITEELTESITEELQVKQVLKMIAKNFDDETIHDLTEMPFEEIAELRQKQQQ